MNDTTGSPPTLLVALTCVILLATAVLHMVFVLPTFEALMGSYGSNFGTPAQLAFAIAQFGLPLGILGGATFGLYVWYRKAPGRAERLATALGVASVVLALYVALLSCAYVDVAISLPTLHSTPSVQSH